VIYEERPLEQVNDAIEEVERGDVQARVVLQP
jgi:D-arabinose 1-dehydrogenase-like Zn-dependent alcohol dehydrogenase